MGDTSWDPASYPREIREEIPRYDELQQRVMEATRDLEPRTILELGTGGGETAHLLLALHPEARMLGVDSSPAMLAAARGALPVERVEFRHARLEAEVVWIAQDLAVLRGDRPQAEET